MLCNSVKGELLAFYYFCGKGFTGGPLAIHQAAKTMNDLGGDASIIYLRPSKSSDRSRVIKRDGSKIMVRNMIYKRRVHKRLKELDVKSASEATIHDHFVVPESDPGLASYLLSIGCRNVHLWWLSVDYFPLKHLHTLEYRSVIHRVHNLCQSVYAYEFVKALGAPNISMLTDFVEFSSDRVLRPTKDRHFDVAYLPAKSTGAEGLIEALGKEYKVIALRNMSRAEVEDTLCDTKFFIDFGYHPGKDRIPREAAMCGCIPYVRKAGAACFDGDVPLPERLRIETQEFFDVGAFVSAFQEVLEDAGSFADALRDYQASILREQKTFEVELLALIALDV